MTTLFSSLAALTAVAATALAADPWADRVVQYSPGSASGSGFTDPSTALGEPTRVTGLSTNFPGPVSPFNTPFVNDEIVSIGEGGSLIVAFDEPVVDDPMNPFGIDLLVFGNSFYLDTSFPGGVAGGLFGEGGLIEVSEDGLTFVPVPGVDADGAFPTLAYEDTPPFGAAPGLLETDFTRPVNPAFDPTGLPYADLVAGYGGSGGGAGVDLASVGLSQISYVRITSTGGTPEIDALADVAAVPEPTAFALALLALAGLAPRERG